MVSLIARPLLSIPYRGIMTEPPGSSSAATAEPRGDVDDDAQQDDPGDRPERHPEPAPTVHVPAHGASFRRDARARAPGPHRRYAAYPVWVNTETDHPKRAYSG